MGRFIQYATGQMPGTMPNASTTGSGTITAGAPILTQNLLQMLADGKLYPVQTADYAVAARGSIVPLTDTGAQVVRGAWREGKSYIKGPDNSIYALTTTNASSGGLLLLRYSPVGAFTQRLVLDSNTTISLYNAGIAFLSNGAILVYAYGSDGTASADCGARFWIINAATMTVTVTSGILPSSSTVGPDPVLGLLPQMPAIPLSGGGFAIAYLTTTNEYCLAIYSNTGVLAGSITNIDVYSADLTGPLFLLQLSTGNIAVFFIRQTVAGSFAPYFAIYNTTAVAVVTETELTNHPVITIPTGSPGGMPSTYIIHATELASGTFAVVTGVGNSVSDTYGYSVDVSVWNSGGTQVGSTAHFSTGAYPWIGNDGTNYWLTYFDAENLYLQTLGTDASLGFSTSYAYSNTPVDVGVYQYCAYDATISGIFILTNLGQTTGCLIYVFNTASKTMFSNAYPYTTNGAVVTPENKANHVLPVGDGVMLVHGKSTATGTSGFSVFKAINSAIFGVATAAAAVGAAVTFDGTSGYKQITPLNGSSNLTFDFSTTPIRGNSGSIAGASVTLKGLS